MKKNNKKSVNRQQNNVNVNYPDLLDSDTLAYMTDEDLESRSDFLHSERRKATQSEIDLTPWEIELCYVQREMKIRSVRRIAHEKFLKENPEINVFNQQIENEDFDNDTNVLN